MPIQTSPRRGAVARLAAALFCALALLTCGCQPGMQGGSDKNASANDLSGRRMVFEIEGMTCDACVDTITKAIEALPGVESAEVSLADRRAVVTGDTAEVSEEAVIAAVGKAGYKARLAGADRNAVGPQRGQASKRGVLVNITVGKDNLHAVSMAVGLAQHALEDGREAAVFLNVAAPVFAAKGLSEDVRYADFPPVGKMLADFIASGGKVYVCRHCGHVCGLEEGELIEGVTVTGHAGLFPQLDDGRAVFSY